MAPDDGPYADLFVRNLRTGRIKRATNSVDPNAGFIYADVRQMVLTRNGALAWIVRPYSNKGDFDPCHCCKYENSIGSDLGCSTPRPG